jgi:very-short-patch-repair endonuclease
VDFYAPKAKLAIEVDGSQHLQNESAVMDKKRDEYLTGLGLKVLRFNSREVMTNTDEVAEAIHRAMKALLIG